MKFIREKEPEVVSDMMNTQQSTYNVQVIGVPQLDNYKSCLQCRAHVEPLSPPLGNCTKEDCLMMQLFNLCPDFVTAHVLLRHLNDKGQYDHVTCSAFGDMVYQLANLPKNHPITKQTSSNANKSMRYNFSPTRKLSPLSCNKPNQIVY